MKRIFGGFILAVLMLASWASVVMGAQIDAPKAKELYLTESLWDFLAKLPASSDGQIFEGLCISTLAGSVASWLYKWSQGQADGLQHFTPRYVVGQTMWIIGSALMAVVFLPFVDDTGKFVGWMFVLWGGGMAGWSGDIKVKLPSRETWTPEQRAARGQP